MECLNRVSVFAITSGSAFEEARIFDLTDEAWARQEIERWREFYRMNSGIVPLEIEAMMINATGLALVAIQRGCRVLQSPRGLEGVCEFTIREKDAKIEILATASWNIVGIPGARRGVGTNLLASVFDTVLENPHIESLMLLSKTLAAPFYEKIGFASAEGGKKWISREGMRRRLERHKKQVVYSL